MIQYQMVFEFGKLNFFKIIQNTVGYITYITTLKDFWKTQKLFMDLKIFSVPNTYTDIYWFLKLL